MLRSCDKRICPVTGTLARRDGYVGNMAEQSEDSRNIFIFFFLSRLLSRLHIVILEIYFRNNARALAKCQREFRTIDLPILCSRDR